MEIYLDIIEWFTICSDELYDCCFFLLLQADFMKMPFPDNSFDAVYAIDATCHAPDVVCQFEIILQ